MKAQAAIMEAFLAVAVLSASISAMAASAYNYSAVSAAMNTSQADAAFDISGAIYGNSLLNSCLAEWDKGCITNLTSNARAYYELSYLGIGISGNPAISSGNMSHCIRRSDFCAPFRSGSNYTTMCITSCV
ncbi:MAG: hypothetical protein KGH58_01240 [Candidatus Micrarchaeota archaeon]|nr:hypothetical protein [Candidatus Micrarchaeota archaeon]